MIKTLKIGEKEVQLNNNIGWTIAYKDQFGRDIIPSLMPMLAGAMDFIFGTICETGKTENISLEDIAQIADSEVITNTMIHLSGLEFVDFINITWALAKCADDTIAEPKEWVKQFDDFALDEIAPAVGELIIKGLVSSKNLKRLKNLKKMIQPQSNSTQSSSQESKED